MCRNHGKLTLVNTMQVYKLTDKLKKLYLYKGDYFLISVFMEVTNINGAPSAENSLPKSNNSNSRCSQGKCYSATGHLTEW